MLAQQGSLVHVHAKTKQKRQPHAHPQRLVNTPENQHQRQQIRHPCGTAPQTHVLQHVETQSHQQAGPDKKRVGRQQQLLAAAQASVLADYYGALQEYQLRQNEVVDTLQPLQEHGKEISEIAEAAFAQGGTDLLRLLDAERAQLDAQLAYVQGMIEYQQSIVNLEAAEGVAP